MTLATWFVAVGGMMLMALLGGLQLIAVVEPPSEWTIEYVYGGDPTVTDPRASFAFNQGYAWADALFWAPLQIATSIGMLLGQRWGFLPALMVSVPFWGTDIRPGSVARRLGETADVERDSWAAPSVGRVVMEHWESD